MKEKSFSLEVIIPIRYHSDYDLIERIKWRSEFTSIVGLNFTVVDDGSENDDSKIIKSTCDSLGIKYIKVNSQALPFSLSRARNEGIKKSDADYIYFEDVDIKNYSEFYVDLFNEIEIQLVEKNRVFINIPVIYLSEFANKLILNRRVDKSLKSKIIDESYDPDSIYIQHHAPVSSLFCMSRDRIIKMGGFDEKYQGWGFEDSDFAFKALSASSLTKPRNFSKLDTRNYSDQVDFNGWRSYFRVFGDMCYFKGIVAFHAFHIPAKDKSTVSRERNRKIFLENIKEYSSSSFVPAPLISQGKEKALFFSKNPFSYNIETLAAFGDVVLENEKRFYNDDIITYVRDNDIDVVVFNNPYGTEIRTAIYEKIKNNKIPFLVVERGALPDSVYFDDTGFCAESKLYNMSLWDHELSQEKSNSVYHYIAKFKTSRETLEKQKTSGDIRRIKKEAKNKSIIFCALQSPSDTTTNFFCGDIGSYDNFINEITKLPKISDDILVLYKNHPLSKKAVNIQGAICVDDLHINDVLEISDYVVLLNSGVGVISMMYDTLVIHFGEAFYSCEQLNAHAKTASDIINIVKEKRKIDIKKRDRFISYLINDLYSFAKWKHDTRKHTDLADMSIATDIKYYKISIPGRLKKTIPAEDTFDLKRSILFDRYRMSEYIFNKAKRQDATPHFISPPSLTQKKETPNTIKERKRRKLKNKPVLYFYDMFKNKVAKIRKTN